jgi:predicted metal-dependent phosphoesterase TrpH
MKNIDLHNHSRISDGLLTPTELVRLAAKNQVTTLALTDHDDVGGLNEARTEAQALGMGFVNGVEISTTWHKHTIHVVGLNLDPTHAGLLSGLSQVRQGRFERAERIAHELARAGIPGALEGALKYAGNPNIVARPHFARYLVEKGIAKDVPSVFKRFLVKGKSGYVSHQWAQVADAVEWINQAGGIAVLAHPGRYNIGIALMDQLLDEFVEAGGRGIEVVTGNHSRDQVESFSRQADRRSLYASRGADYHGPGESYCEPGRLPPLPAHLVPVWEVWEGKTIQ